MVYKYNQNYPFEYQKKLKNYGTPQSAKSLPSATFYGLNINLKLMQLSLFTHGGRCWPWHAQKVGVRSFWHVRSNRKHGSFLEEFMFPHITEIEEQVGQCVIFMQGVVPPNQYMNKHKPHWTTTFQTVGYAGMGLLHSFPEVHGLFLGPYKEQLCWQQFKVWDICGS